jgi:hypothetical protein
MEIRRRFESIPIGDVIVARMTPQIEGDSVTKDMNVPTKISQ